MVESNFRSNLQGEEKKDVTSTQNETTEENGELGNEEIIVKLSKDTPSRKDHLILSPIKKRIKEEKEEFYNTIIDSLYSTPVSFDLFDKKEVKDDEGDDIEKFKKSIHYTPIRRRLKYPNDTTELIRVGMSQNRDEHRANVDGWIKEGRRMQLTKFKEYEMTKKLKFTVHDNGSDKTENENNLINGDKEQSTSNVASENKGLNSNSEIKRRSDKLNNSKNDLINEKQTELFINKIPSLNKNIQSKALSILFPKAEYNRDSIIRNHSVFDLDLAVKKETKVDCKEVKNIHQILLKIFEDKLGKRINYEPLKSDAYDSLKESKGPLLDYMHDRIEENISFDF